MKLIVGLGNYPKEYTNTRHNIGFLALDYIYNNWSFDNWKEDKKLKGIISKGFFEQKECFLLKPQTFMNLSGESVIKVIKFYKIKTEDMIVIHDDIDLNFAIIKPTLSRNSAGHNGIKSINSVINDNYKRIRIGVGRPIDKRFDISDYVLSKFSQQENEKIQDIMEKLILTLKTIL